MSKGERGGDGGKEADERADTGAACLRGRKEVTRWFFLKDSGTRRQSVSLVQVMLSCEIMTA